jgi:2-polyprenyl-3-methyl-5-hydroxy-6-metoxy-1,4-benzoquinol methylase
VAIGVFIGCQPLYGLHFVLVLAVCVPLRLDAVLSYLAANISNPLVAPFLIVAEVEVGSYLTSGRFVAFDVASARENGAAGFARQLFVGSVTLGALFAVVGFALAWLVASRFRGRGQVGAADPFDAAISRTRDRYARAPRAHRFYVAGKLAFDPVGKLLAELPGSFGRVLDLGCGRGQLSLLLLELGRATRVVGIDSDASKIEVARAAGPEGDFRVADLSPGDATEADTILLVDVLHYLPLAEQDALLRAAARALAVGGRLLVREVDAHPSAKSGVTRLFEWLARKTGMNRGRATAYRPARDVTALLSGLGLPCEVQGASERTPFANVLIVAGGSPRSSVEDSSASSTLISAAKA